MPFFALAYGSVGDFIATVQLLITIAGVLHRSGRPSKECGQTEQELQLLRIDLMQLTTLPTIDPASPVAMYAASRIEAEVKQCQTTMRKFQKKISARKHLLRKIQWALSEEKELASFRMQIIDRRASLSLVVNVMNSGALAVVHDRIDEVGGQVCRETSQIRSGVDCLVDRITAYQAQIVAIVGNVPHGVAEEVFWVISPTGVPIPISVVYCTSYQVLDGILKMYLRERREAGARYVERGDYNVVSPEGEVIRPLDFVPAIKHGIRLEMGIIKRQTGISRRAKKCPQCGLGGGAPSHGGWITCQTPSCHGSRFQVVREELSFGRLLLDQGNQAPVAFPPACKTQDSYETSIFRLVTEIIVFADVYSASRQPQKDTSEPAETFNDNSSKKRRRHTIVSLTNEASTTSPASFFSSKGKSNDENTRSVRLPTLFSASFGPAALLYPAPSPSPRSNTPLLGQTTVSLTNEASTTSSASFFSSKGKSNDDNTRSVRLPTLFSASFGPAALLYPAPSLAPGRCDRRQLPTIELLNPENGDSATGAANK